MTKAEAVETAWAAAAAIETAQAALPAVRRTLGSGPTLDEQRLIEAAGELETALAHVRGAANRIREIDADDY